MGKQTENIASKYDFTTSLGRKKFIEEAEQTLYGGKNEDGETVIVTHSKWEELQIVTHQHNGWIRINEYDKDGFSTLETFGGRWTKEESQ